MTSVYCLWIVKYLLYNIEFEMLFWDQIGYCISILQKKKKEKKKKKKQNGQKLIRGYSVTAHLCYRITFFLYFPYILTYCILYVNHIIYYWTIVTVNTFSISQCKSQDSPWEKSHMMRNSSSSSAHFGKYLHFWFWSPSLSPCHISHLTTHHAHVHVPKYWVWISWGM